MTPATLRAPCTCLRIKVRARPQPAEQHLRKVAIHRIGPRRHRPAAQGSAHERGVHIWPWPSAFPKWTAAERTSPNQWTKALWPGKQIKKCDQVEKRGRQWGGRLYPSTSTVGLRRARTHFRKSSLGGEPTDGLTPTARSVVPHDSIRACCLSGYGTDCSDLYVLECTIMR